MFNLKSFESCILNKRNIKFITIDKTFFSKEKIPFFPLPEAEQYNTLFQKIKTIIEVNSKYYIFVIFYEYFFGRKILKCNQKDSIINNLKNIMKGIKNVFFFLPFLYENEVGPDKNELKDILNYCEQVPVDYKTHPFVFWEVENNTKYDKNKTKWISNEIFILYEDEIIMSHKKGVYYNEIIPELFKNYNYYYGMGKNKIITKNKIKSKIAEIIDKYFYLGICKEVKDEIDYLKFYFIKFDYSILNEKLKKICEDKRELFQRLNTPPYFEKKYFIIISNTTELYDIIHTFPDKSIVIQCDPESTQAFSINYSENLNYKLEKSKFKIIVEKEKDLIFLRKMILGNIFNLVKNINCITSTNSENNTLINIFCIN